jgi:tetratricopeptide (TPR) repeat protein
MPSPPAYEYGRLGALWISVSNFSAAESALLKGLAKDPYCYACHLELGELYIRTGKFSLSQKHLRWVIRFFPDDDPVAYRSLVAVDLILHDNAGARRALNEGLRVFPNDPALLKAQAALRG